MIFMNGHKDQWGRMKNPGLDLSHFWNFGECQSNEGKTEHSLNCNVMTWLTIF